MDFDVASVHWLRDKKNGKAGPESWKPIYFLNADGILGRFLIAVISSEWEGLSVNFFLLTLIVREVVAKFIALFANSVSLCLPVRFWNNF